MVILGGIISAPAADIYYRKFQPYYMKKLIPKLFPIFRKRFPIYQQVGIALAVDLLLFAWPIIYGMLFSASIQEDKGF